MGSGQGSSKQAGPGAWRRAALVLGNQVEVRGADGRDVWSVLRRGGSKCWARYGKGVGARIKVDEGVASGAVAPPSGRDAAEADEISTGEKSEC